MLGMIGEGVRQEQIQIWVHCIATEKNFLICFGSVRTTLCLFRRQTRRYAEVHAFLIGDRHGSAPKHFHAIDRTGCGSGAAYLSSTQHCAARGGGTRHGGRGAGMVGRDHGAGASAIGGGRDGGRRGWRLGHDRGCGAGLGAIDSSGTASVVELADKIAPWPFWTPAG